MNDFDHALPIIDYISRVKKENVIVYGVGDKYKECTNHLSYLNNVLGIKERAFEDFFYKDIDLKIISFINNLPKLKSSKWKLIDFIVSILILNTQRAVYLYLSRVAGLFINSLPKSGDVCVLMDIGTEGSFPYRHIIEKCQRFNIPILAYLHGFSIFTNLDPIKIKTTKLPRKINLKMQQVLFGKYLGVHFDRYLVGAGQKSTLFKSNFAPYFSHHNLVYEIGLPRYTVEWHRRFISKYDVNYPYLDSINKNDKINVVLFLSSFRYSVKTEELYRMIEELSDLNCINLIIKPHPRFELSDISDAVDKSIISWLGSPTLIKWADVAILYGSSIGFDVLVSGKNLIIPKFVHSNTTIFEEYNIAKVVDSTGDLIDFLENYQPNEKVNQEKINTFINKYVYGYKESYNELMDEFSYFL